MHITGKGRRCSSEKKRRKEIVIFNLALGGILGISQL